MPLYTYQCTGCEHREDKVRQVDKRHKLCACPRCENEMLLIIAKISLRLWKPLELELETNKPKVYESKKDLKADCNRLGKSMPGWDIE